MSDYSMWDKYYHEYPLEELGWELGKPRPVLVKYLSKGLLPKGGNALDLCCGAGTNTIFLAQSGYNMIGIDISITALSLAKRKAQQAKAEINFLNTSFIDLSFQNGIFNFIFDMGCFHHVEINERPKFIAGLHRVLQNSGFYMLTCFSYRNGPGWKHFTRQQIVDLFWLHFDLGDFQHYSSLEGDGMVRFFYTVLMKKKSLTK
jgi:ubiquinone/menaquinone biosynthesis C-methylase UbiE